MTAEQLLTTEPESAGQAQADGTVALIRSSFAVVAPRADEVARHFYATLFGLAPETRDLFPVNMEVQRSRLLRALVHVVQMVDRPAELVPFLEQLGRDHRKFGVLARALRRGRRRAAQRRRGVRRAGLDAGGREGLDRRLRHGGRRDADGRPGRARAGDLAGPGRRAPPDRLGPRDRRGRRERARSRTGPGSTSASRPRSARGCGATSRRRTRPRDDGRLEFHVRAVPGGWVSRSIVAHSRVGDTWRIGPPMGRLHIARNSGRNVLLVAGGTGLAPIRAMLDDLARGEGQPRIQVFIGGRTWDDLYDFAHLRRLSYANPWLDVIPVVERDDTGNGGAEIGTLSDVVTRYGSWADHDVTVCGSPAMIRSTVAQMLVAGTPLDRISYDPFTLD